MTIKECIKNALELLGENQLADNLDGEVRERDALFGMAKNVVTEICADYFPLKITEDIVFKDGSAPFSSFGFRVLDILSVSKDGVRMPFSIMYDRVEAAMDGAAEVEYSFVPQLSLDGELPFPAIITGQTVAYGIAAEYCVANGYEAAGIMDRRYRDALVRAQKSAHGLRREMKIKKRAWA